MKVLKNAKFTGNIKINDTNTDIYFQAYDDGVLQKLNATQCSFRIKNDTGYLITISNVSTENDYITFKSNELKPLPVGTYYLELWVEDGTGTYIYPDENFCKLRINENVTVAQGTTIPTISLDEYESKLQGYVDTAVADGTQKIESDFDKYVDSITDSTIATATKASQDATTAINTANSANDAAQNATNIANAAKSNADSASQAAANAQIAVNDANNNANTAKSTADSAISVANDTKNSFNNAYYGGRNLIQQTENDWGSNSTYFANSNLTSFGSKHYNSNVYSMKNEGASVLIQFNDLSNRYLINTNDIYIFSLYIKKNEYIDLKSYLSFDNGNGLVVSAYTSDLVSNFNKELDIVPWNMWYQLRIPLKFSSQTAPDSSHAYFGIKLISTLDKDKIFVSCPKLERGVNVTDYTPAPEDIETEISNLKSQIKALQSQ